MKISQMPVSCAMPHRMAAAVPVVEVADDRNALGVRRPDREMHARRRPRGRIRCAPSLSKSRRCVPSRDVVVVHRPEHRAEGIGIDQPPFAAGVARRGSAAAGACGGRNRAFEEARHHAAAGARRWARHRAFRRSRPRHPGSRSGRSTGPCAPEAQAVRTDRHACRPPARPPRHHRLPILHVHPALPWFSRYDPQEPSE